MGRSVDTILQSLLDAESCETQTALTILPLTGDPVRITPAKEDISADGETFTPGLRKVSEIIQSTFANTDRCQAVIQSVDKVFSLRALAGDFAKARAIVGRIYRDDYDKSIESFVELFSGEIRPTDVTPTETITEIVDDLPAAGYCVADWSLADPCPFVFKDSLTCAYVGSATSCNKRRFSEGGCSGKVRTDGKDQTAWFGGMEAAEESNSTEPGAGDGGGDYGGGYCFGGEVFVTLADGEEIFFERLYEQRADYIGQNVKTFDADNNLQEGAILDVYKSIAYVLLHVRFVGEPRIMRVKGEHRFWTETGFVSMKDLHPGDKVYTDSFDFAEIESIETVDYARGEAVYNLTVEEFHAYFARSAGGEWKAVSNSKPIGSA